MFTRDEQKFLLEYARQTLFNYLNNQTHAADFDVGEKFLEKRGVFVTLTNNEQLRGCIGLIEPILPILKAIEENAVTAAVNDPRFAPVSFDELQDISIEISILSKPEINSYEDVIPYKHGVIVKKGCCKATFLPQVWDEIQDKELFFEKLILKAGLFNTRVNSREFDIYTYEVTAFSDNDFNDITQSKPICE